MDHFSPLKDFDTLFHSTPIGFVILSKKNQILQVNQTIVDWLGYQSVEDIQGRYFQELLSPKDKIYYETHFYPLIFIQNFIREIHFHLIKKDLQLLPVLIDGKIISFHNDSIFLFTITNITQREMYENELKRQKQEVEKLYDKLMKSLKSIDREIAKAESLQKYLLPKPFTSKEKGFSIDYLYLPLDRVSGDIFDYFQLDENIYRIFLADATGHGLTAGFQTMSIYTEYQRIKRYFSLENIVQSLNHLTFDLFKDWVLIHSCIILDLDLDNKKLSYISAGHPSQIYLEQNPKNNKIDIIELKTTCPIVGSYPFLKAIPKTIPIQEPFKIYLFTDGIEEVLNENNEIFGFDGIKKSIMEYSQNQEIPFFSFLMEQIDRFKGKKSILDDITVIQIHKNLGF